MAVWAIYSDSHREVDIEGDRHGLRTLAAAVASSEPTSLQLTDPPLPLLADSHPLDAIEVQPTAEPGARINFERIDDRLVISGSSGELARITASAILDLADGPATINTVGAHVHLDATSDPEGNYYAPGSASLVVGLAELDA